MTHNSSFPLQSSSNTRGERNNEKLRRESANERQYKRNKNFKNNCVLFVCVCFSSSFAFHYDNVILTRKKLEQMQKKIKVSKQIDIPKRFKKKKIVCIYTNISLTEYTYICMYIHNAHVCMYMYKVGDYLLVCLHSAIFFIKWKANLYFFPCRPK